tara:strand:- start:29022 stop:30776 length:1755 start_codon:yes stop_codon:yes gene_type:complete
MKKPFNYILLFVVQFALIQMSAQGTTASLVNLEKLVPNQEKVFVHSNSRLAFVGEYIYYSIYCLKDNTGLLSDVSKIAYLKLVNENEEIVLNQKIKLINGKGNSNFFLPSTIPSGNYKLIAYTKWMLNNGNSYFYSNDITIVNPYTSNQAVFRNKNVGITEDSSIITSKTENNTIANSALSIDLGENTYATRQPINLKITASTVEGLGNYSISVRKVDELGTKETLSSLNFKNSYPEKSKVDHLILPELRGELFVGELSASNDSLSIKNKSVALSFPGKDYLFKTATSDANGRFYANVEEDYTAEDVYVQVMNNPFNEFEISLSSEEALNLSNLKFNKFTIHRDMETLIQERSIYNQIENAYYSSKPDTILIGKPNMRFYGEGTMNYVLDEYTRFSSIKETFVEVVEHVWIQQNKEGQNEFHVRPIAPFVETGKLPLVFVDGILVQDHERLINLSSAQVESINISRNQHFYGTRAFQGVVDVVTFKSNFYENYYTPSMLSQKLFKPNESKNYYEQSYEGNLKESNKRLPDFRYQLLWTPTIKMAEKVENITFYSSDITGEFEVSLEGFTNAGLPVSLKKNFWVK